MSNNDNNNGPSTAKVAFGVFMIIIYIGFGVLCLVNSHGEPIFDFIDKGIFIALGCILIVYGIWRGYRLFSGRN